MAGVITYGELERNLQREFDKLPIEFAFTDAQFERGVKELGLDPSSKEDLGKLVRIPGGGFCLVETAEKMSALFERFNDEVEKQIFIDRLNMTGFTKDMFISELDNHEYGYTGDVTEALDALGYDFDEDIATDDFLLEQLYRAEQEIMNREW